MERWALKRWDDLPGCMRTEAVRPYYDRLRRKWPSLALKRAFDFALATFLAVMLMPAMLAVAVGVMADSRGGAFFVQERVTRYGRKFKILKFRTMAANREGLGPEVSAGNDARITRIGRWLRRYRLDELPQLFNIILGDMSFCGTRPEVPRFVRRYSPEMMATLLLPAGVTSEASIRYRDEAGLLAGAEDAEEAYVREILPEKMKYNLRAVREFGILRELRVMAETVCVVAGQGLEG